MPKKPFINSLRLMMAAGSVAGFVGGWALLAQSGKDIYAESSAQTIWVETHTTVQAQDLITVTPSTASALATSTNTSVQAASTATTVEPTATPSPTATAIKVSTAQSASTQTRLRTGGS